MIQIVEFSELSQFQLQQAVRILCECFANTPSVYADLSQADSEVARFIFGEECGALAALDGADVRGWIGWLEGYSHAWELHPLVVDPSHQGRGIGTSLVRALEHRARSAGMISLWLGADDEAGGTNLYGVDVLPGALKHATTVQPSDQQRHPIAFYRKVGFEVVGLLPDVNGFGKPDILMAKRLSAPASVR